MGYIKEPHGVDFEVINRKMSEKERKLVSDYIKKDKEKLVKKESGTKMKRTSSRKKILHS